MKTNYDWEQIYLKGSHYGIRDLVKDIQIEAIEETIIECADKVMRMNKQENDSSVELFDVLCTIESVADQLKAKL